jgi:hypothetical protein
MFFSLEPSTRIEEDALYSKRPVMVKVMAFISSGSCCVKTALMTRSGKSRLLVDAGEDILDDVRAGSMTAQPRD